LNTIQLNAAAVKLLEYFVAERQRIYLAKQADKPKPWTKDRILQQYSFCNVFREQDRVTIWVKDHIRKPYSEHPHLWWMLCAARLFNWPQTLEALMATKSLGAWPHKTNSVWSTSTALTTLKKIKGKVFTGAYIVSTNGLRMDKASYVVERVLLPLWKGRNEIRALLKPELTLASFHAELSLFNGMGSFLAAQVVADYKHCQGQHLADAPDWYTWAASGPGSRRGLNRMYGRDITAPWKEREWLAALAPVRGVVNSALHKAKLIPKEAEICMQDTQNCLCEFDKYVRTKNGEGRPRATYPGV
jgi:hypothetical protein